MLSPFFYWWINVIKGIFLTNCTTNLLLVTYHNLFIKSIWWKVGHKQLCCSLTLLTKKYGSKSFKKYILIIFSFSSWHVSLYIETTKEFLAFIKSTVNKSFIKSSLFLSYVLHSTLIGWMIIKGEQVWLACLNFI